MSRGRRLELVGLASTSLSLGISFPGSWGLAPPTPLCGCL